MKRLLLLLAACGHDAAHAPDASVDAPCPTTISGIVTTPNGVLPLAGVTVYVPAHDPGPLSDVLACERCGTPAPGGAIAQTRTDTAGRFSLAVPAGDVAVVIQIGKWRRQLVVPASSCTNTALDPADSRLPSGRADASPHTAIGTDGAPKVDLPRIAIVSGVSDAFECVPLQLGIDPAEVTNDTGGGHVQLYANRHAASGPAGARGADHFVAGWLGGDGAPFGDAEALWSSFDSLARYDMVMMGCDGDVTEATKPQSARDAMKQFADAGGRVIASHLERIWLTGEPAWASVATFDADAAGAGDSIPATIDEAASPLRAAFASWLVTTGASVTRDEVYVHGANYQCTAVDSTVARTWLAVEPDEATSFHQAVELFDVATPVEQPGHACGHVVYTDLHMAYGSSSTSTVPYPMQCTTEQLFPQAKAFAWLVFGLSDCAADQQ